MTRILIKDCSYYTENGKRLSNFVMRPQFCLIFDKHVVYVFSMITGETECMLEFSSKDLLSFMKFRIIVESHNGIWFGGKNTYMMLVNELIASCPVLNTRSVGKIIEYLVEKCWYKKDAQIKQLLDILAKK